MPATYTDRLEGVSTSEAVKPPCRVATRANITLSGLQSIDGVTVAERDRVLVKDQSDAVENGIWNAQSGEWIRALDFDGSRDAVGGTLVHVNAGTNNGDTYWTVSGDGMKIVGVDEITFDPSSGNIDLQAALAASGGSALVGFLQGGAGAVARTAQSKMRDIVSVADFGAVGDGVTDDYPAFAAAIAYLGAHGGVIRVPPRRHRLSATLTLTTAISFIGDYKGRNSGIVGATTYPFPDFLFGSALYFDAGVPGILLIANSTTDGSTWTYQGATWATLENLHILSAGGGTNGTNGTHAVEARTRFGMSNCYIRNWGGDGVRISATSSGSHGDSKYGNANLSRLTDVASIANRGNGFYIVGRDANVVRLDNCDASNNELWGYYDNSLLGNTYLACHSQVNDSGSFACISQVASSVYLGCYIEQGGDSWLTDLNEACIWLGGQGAGSSSHQPDTPCLILGAAGYSFGAPIKQINSQGTVDITTMLGVSGTDHEAFAWGNSDDAPGINFKLKYEGVVGTPKWWSIQYAGTFQYIQYPTSAAAPRQFAPSFPKGFFLGNGGGGPRVFYGAVESGKTYNRGDILFASAPSAGGSMGQVCITTGVGGSTAAFKDMPSLAA